MKIFSVLMIIVFNAICVAAFTFPTVVEAELGKSCTMTFTFDPVTSNMSQFHISDVTTTDVLVSIVQGVTTVNPNWEARANIVDNIATGSVTVTLTPALIEDEGWYRVTMDTGYSEQSGLFPIVAYAQPISLTIAQTEGEDANGLTNRLLRCTGNVGMPNPVLRLLQSPPYNDVTNHEIMRYRPTSQLQNGTFYVDHTFNVTFPFSDNGTYVVCDVTHEITLSKPIRPIRSEMVLVLVEPPVLVSGQSITITGPSTVTTPTSELRITCTPSTVGISDINSITIKKNSSTLDYQNVVSVTYSKANSDSVLTWGSIISNTRAGVSATGNVNTVSGASLVLTIATNRTTCTDGGAYQCLMGVTLTGGSGGVADAEKYVAATESPTSTNNPLTVFPFPNVDSTYYSVGTMLTLTCSGTVGSERKEHTWCYKRANDFTYTGYPIGADINQNNDNLVQSGCNYLRTSTLSYNVTEADSNTTFMCEPFTGSMCGSNPASLIGYLSIKRYSTGGNTGAQDDAAGASSAGTIAGAVIGCMAAILLIVLIVYFVVFRRRGGGETYNTKEDGTPEGPAHTEGPVYSVPDKNRARGKHGHDNNAMDEPREEKRHRRRRDRDDYDDGRGYANKAMHDNYSDQDGDIGGSVDGGHPVGIGSAV
ncbi:uncharacterized protein [Argopecten irradians]|uniref:uncharacterized protein isoform X2 n=1 Tax=Argopecten irradians TaxID=31199 RepID=UPI003720E4C5